MASSDYGRAHRTSCIVIRNPKLLEITTENSKKILKLNNTEFVVYEKQMIAASIYIKRIHFSEPSKKLILLDNLKIKEPCFDTTGLAMAVSFATGFAEIPLNRIISALAAANVLEMWDMRMAIVKQLRKLAGEPESAPFAINVAACNLEKQTARYIASIMELKSLQESLEKFDEVIKQSNFLVINDKSFEFFISLFIYENSLTVDRHEKQIVAESAVRAIRIWCGNDHRRYTFTKNMVNKLRRSCDIEIIDQIERAVAEHLAIHSLPDKTQMANEQVPQRQVRRIRRRITRSPITDSNQLLKFEAFRQIEFPAAKPDANGIHHYSIVVEFEASKELLPPDKPKHIGLQLEAILECPN